MPHAQSHISAVTCVIDHVTGIKVSWRSIAIACKQSEMLLFDALQYPGLQVGLQSNFTRLDICQKTEKNKFTGNCCVDCKSNWFQFSGYIYDEGSNFKGAIYATTTQHIPLGFHSEDTFLSDGNDWHLHFETSQESLFTAKHNKSKPNKQGKCKLKLCDLPLCTQSGRWHAFHILFERVPTSPNVDDRTHGGPKWEAGFYMGQRQEDYRGQINGGSREAGILTWIASRRTHGATCI